jgi:hypothetical protein
MMSLNAIIGLDFVHSIIHVVKQVASIYRRPLPLYTSQALQDRYHLAIKIPRQISRHTK